MNYSAPRLQDEQYAKNASFRAFHDARFADLEAGYYYFFFGRNFGDDRPRQRFDLPHLFKYENGRTTMPHPAMVPAGQTVIRGHERILLWPKQ